MSLIYSQLPVVIRKGELDIMKFVTNYDIIFYVSHQ